MASASCLLGLTSCWSWLTLTATRSAGEAEDLQPCWLHYSSCVVVLLLDVKDMYLSQVWQNMVTLAV
jgi:hypothetical protein